MVRNRGRKLNAARIFLHDTLAATGEFAGTFMFLFLGYLGAQSALQNAPQGTLSQTQDNSTLMAASLAFGMSLLVTAWAFFRICGSAFNPAVTLSLWLIGGLTIRRAIYTALAQLIGGIAAAAMVKALTTGPLLVENTLTGISPGQGFGIETFTTSLLVFTVLMVAAEKSKDTYLAPVAIGLALFIGHIASIGYTGTGMNPARTLGPSVVNANFPNYAYIYYLAQITGSLLATSVFVLLKYLRYDETVGDIDTSNKSASAKVHKGPMGTLAGKLGVEQLDRVHPLKAHSEKSLEHLPDTDDMTLHPEAAQHPGASDTEVPVPGPVTGRRNLEPDEMV